MLGYIRPAILIFFSKIEDRPCWLLTQLDGDETKEVILPTADKEKKVIKEMSGDDMLDYLDKHDGKIVE